MSAVLSGARAPTILVVDDSLAVRQLTVSVLRRQGYDVLEAGDGREGLDTALREQPDVILCDIHMPILDGWDVVREARSSESLGTTPILMLTSDNDRENDSGPSGSGPSRLRLIKDGLKGSAKETYLKRMLVAAHQWQVGRDWFAM